MAENLDRVLKAGQVVQVVLSLLSCAVGAYSLYALGGWGSKKKSCYDVTDVTLETQTFKSLSTQLTQSSTDSMTFDDLAGLEEPKEVLQDIVSYLKEMKSAKLQPKCSTGVLLVGKSGTGKTALCRAFAAAAQATFYTTVGSKLCDDRNFSLRMQTSEDKVTDLFRQARKNAPSIIYLDEIDGIGSRGSSALATLLVEMDGIEKSKKPGNYDLPSEDLVIVIGATNRIDLLDPALLRPGRFDHVIEIDLPNAQTREQILLLHARGATFENACNWKELASLSMGLSGAQLGHAIRESVRQAYRKKWNAIPQQLVEDNILKQSLGKSWPSQGSQRSLINFIDKERFAFHETGHTVLFKHFEQLQKEEKHKGLLLPNIKLVRVSIASRGIFGGLNLFESKEEYGGYGAYRAKLDDDLTNECPFDILLLTKTQLENWIIVLWGGYVAEKCFCGETSTGVEHDLKMIRQIRDAYLHRFGMGSSLHFFLSPLFSSSSSSSENKSPSWEEDIAYKCKQEAEKIIQEHAPLCQLMAKELMQKETLGNEEIDSFLARSS